MAFETLFRFLLQSNISPGNLAAIEAMYEINDCQFLDFLEIVHAIATIHPRKRRRWKTLRVNYPELYERIRDNENFDWLLYLDHSNLRDPERLEYLDALPNEEHPAEDFLY